MSKRKKINKLKVFIVLIAFVVFFMIVTGLGRFVYNTVKEGYLSSKEFYFKSNLLTTNGISYKLENWDGKGIYEIDLALLSQNNELEKFNGDLPYTLVINYDDTDILCTPIQYEYKESKNTQVIDVYDNNDARYTGQFIIPKETNSDRIKLYIKPNIDENGEDKELKNGDEYTISVTAYTTNPYRKKIMADFVFEIQEVSYSIDDHIDRPYVILNVRNASNIEADVTVEFDNNVLRLDMNDSLCARYINNKNMWKPENDDLQNIEMDEKGFVKSFTFRMNEETSRDIKFYKTSDDNPLIEITQLSEIFNITKKEVVIEEEPEEPEVPEEPEEPEVP